MAFVLNPSVSSQGVAGLEGTKGLRAGGVSLGTLESSYPFTMCFGQVCATGTLPFHPRGPMLCCLSSCLICFHAGSPGGDGFCSVPVRGETFTLLPQAALLSWVGDGGAGGFSVPFLVAGLFLLLTVRVHSVGRFLPLQSSR